MPLLACTMCLMAETFNTRNTLTGKIARLTADQISTNVEYLEIVADDAKPYEPGMFKPGKVGEFKNTEPLTDAELDAQAQLDAVLETKSSKTNAAKEAKAAVKAAEVESAAAAEQAQKEAADAAAELAAATNSGDTNASGDGAPATQEGGN